jgi:hypothetical protein
VPTPIEQVRVKIERAKRHFGELGTEISAFSAISPYKVSARRDPETRRPIYFVSDVTDTPVVIATIAGDVLHNLRSALDHLAYQLVMAGTAGKPPGYLVYFPIGGNLVKYEAKKVKDLRGARPEVVAEMDAVKPYKGGSDDLWRLHKLSNIDKHRFLIAVGSAYRSLDLGAVVWQTMKKSLAGRPEADNFAKMEVPRLFLKPADRLFPLKVGDELFIDSPDAEVNDKVQFRFDIALGEPEADVNGDPLVETLQKLVDVVESTTRRFERFL